MMVIQWCLILKTDFYKSTDSYGCVPKVGVLQRLCDPKLVALSSLDRLKLCPGIITYQLCLGASDLACTNYFICSRKNEWVDMLKSLPSASLLPMD